MSKSINARFDRPTACERSPLRPRMRLLVGSARTPVGGSGSPSRDACRTPSQAPNGRVPLPRRQRPTIGTSSLPAQPTPWRDGRGVPATRSSSSSCAQVTCLMEYRPPSPPGRAAAHGPAAARHDPLRFVAVRADLERVSGVARRLMRRSWPVGRRAPRVAPSVNERWWRSPSRPVAERGSGVAARRRSRMGRARP